MHFICWEGLSVNAFCIVTNSAHETPVYPVLLLQCANFQFPVIHVFYTLINYQYDYQNDNNTLYTVNHVNIADLSINCQIIHEILKQNK